MSFCCAPPPGRWTRPSRRGPTRPTASSYGPGWRRRGRTRRCGRLCHARARRWGRWDAVALAESQLRAAGRPTPFGLFAGVAGARFGGSTLVRFGEEPRAAARCAAAWLLSVIERCEACAPLAGRLTAVFSSLAVPHAGKWEVPAGPDRQTIRDSPAVRAVRDAAQASVQISALADMLSSAFPGTGDKSARMLAKLVKLGFLITSLRPPMTATDALGHVSAGLRAAGAHEISETAHLLEQLEALH